MAQHGVERLLTGLHQHLRWHPPVLHCHLPDGPHGDVHLDGRGLLLVPSIFARIPDFLADTATPMITYPIAVGAEFPLWHEMETTTGHLADLIGRTRAGILRHLAAHPGPSTNELVHYLEISLPAVSKHTAVVRASGLLASGGDISTCLDRESPVAGVVCFMQARWRTTVFSTYVPRLRL